jgi:hypothetical protein
LNLVVAGLVMLTTLSAFAGSTIHCLGRTGKLKMNMELVTNSDNCDSFDIKANMTGKAEMSGQVQKINRFGVYEGPLTDIGDPLEIVLVFLQKNKTQNQFNILLKIEDGEKIDDFSLVCQGNLKCEL